MKAIFLLSLVVLSMSLSASAETYYADVSFNIGNDGNVLVKGLTNHPQLAERTTQEFTSKKGWYWVFNATIEDNFSNFVYTINLPEGAVINYIKSSTPVRIGNTFVKATGKDAKLQIAMQYSIEPTSSKGYIPIIAAAVIAAIVIAILILRKKQPVHHADLQHSDIQKQEAWYDKDTVTDRQRQIIEIIESEAKPVTQKQLEERMSIPKSSLSRNIESLVARGIVRKDTKGMTNVITLNKKKPEI